MNLRKILRYVEYVIGVLLLGITIFAVAEYVQGIQPFYTISDNPSSMSPTLNYGDVAVVYRCSFGDLKAGDIIIFNDPRGNPQTIIHRVAEVKNPQNTTEYLITKGDNNSTNPSYDPWNVTSTSYLSRVLVTIPYVGYISPALWGLSGPAVLLPFALLTFVFYFASYFWKQYIKTKPGG